jgi:hypothetical protein
VDKEEAKQTPKQKVKKKDQPHLSKKAKKTLKERKEIEKELREAEAEVDKEEREITVSPRLSPLNETLTRFFVANGDIETAVRAVLPDTEEPDTYDPSSRRAVRNCQVRPFGQHRLFQGPHAGVEGLD